MENKRNYGIDTLRIVSMLLIMIMHSYTYGGIISNTEFMSTNFLVAHLIKAFCLVSVNCYAMITGYVCYKIIFRMSRLINLWLQVVYYTVLITVIVYAVYPDFVGLKQFVFMIIPVSSFQYWYFTQYFALFFSIPLLNKIIEIIDIDNFKKVVIVFGIILSVIPTVVDIDLFFTNNGCSFIWFMYMYMIGAYIKRCDIVKSRSTCILNYIVFSLISFAIKIIFCYLNGNTDGGNIWFIYTSPFVVFASIYLLLYFKQLKINRIKIITFFAEGSFSVYLIHVHPLIWQNFWKNSFVNLLRLNTIELLFADLIIVAVIFILLDALDWWRRFLFKIINIKRIISRVENMVNIAFNSICRIIKL